MQIVTSDDNGIAANNCGDIIQNFGQLYQKGSIIVNFSALSKQCSRQQLSVDAGRYASRYWNKPFLIFDGDLKLFIASNNFKMAPVSPPGTRIDRFFKWWKLHFDAEDLYNAIIATRCSGDSYRAFFYCSISESYFTCITELTTSKGVFVLIDGEDKQPYAGRSKNKHKQNMENFLDR